ncbi:hypothetical protein [Devosia submarina]|uniref:hypothetical protein n=1 Tax=Devosia submarina TaxID=1173082 RepID=UPI000D3B7BBC|nr:hypothetical protein [Devosia submarina]
MNQPVSHDPLSQLPPDRIPEPSPGHVQETIAAAQQLFARQPVRMPGSHKPGRRVFFGRTWMEAILGAGLVSTACVLALVLSPAFLMTPLAPEPEPVQTGPIRTEMMVPPQGVQPLDLDMIVDLEPYTNGELRLGVRNADDRFALYHVDEQGLEQQLLEGRKGAAEAVSIFDAVLAEWDGQQVLAVRSGFGDLQRWDAFVETRFGFEVSAALSRQIWDAADAAEVEQRLAAAVSGS